MNSGENKSLQIEGGAAGKMLRKDLQLIASLIKPSQRILDIGCGDGALLEYLVQEKGVDGRGVEISQSGVNACVERGLSVVQGDADMDLVSYPTKGFDVVILSQTLQATRHPDRVLTELVRIGKQAIVSVPNFGKLSIRLQLLRRGRMPRTITLGYEWYDTPNIHLCTIADFLALTREKSIQVEKFITVSSRGNFRFWMGKSYPNLANLLADQAIFILTEK